MFKVCVIIGISKIEFYSFSSTEKAKTNSMLLLQYYGIILFQIAGSVPVSMKFLKIIDGGVTTNLLHNLIIQIDTSSWTCALLMLRALTIFNVTSSLKQNEESLAAETYCDELGKLLLLTRGVDFEAKKLLK